MIAGDADLIVTRREAWLCVLGLVVGVVAFPALLVVLLIDVRSTTWIVALFAVFVAYFGSQVALMMLWHERHRRMPVEFPSWCDRNLYFHTAIWSFKRARYPTSFRRARQLLQAPRAGDPRGYQAPAPGAVLADKSNGIRW